MENGSTKSCWHGRAIDECEEDALLSLRKSAVRRQIHTPALPVSCDLLPEPAAAAAGIDKGGAAAWSATRGGQWPRPPCLRQPGQ
jgi:hypothetical protein